MPGASVKSMRATSAQQFSAARMPACWPALIGWKLTSEGSSAGAEDRKPKVRLAGVPMPPGLPAGVPMAAGKFHRAEA